MLDDVRRGSEAKQVLESRVYKEAYTAIRERIVSVLCLAETTDDKRKRLNDLLIALEKVKMHMEQVMQSGNMAAEQIERERTFKDRILRRA